MDGILKGLTPGERRAVVAELIERDLLQEARKVALRIKELEERGV